MKAHIGVGADSGLMHTVIGGGSGLGYMESIRPVRIGDGHTGALALLRIGPQGMCSRRMGLQGACTIDARQGHITARLIDIGASVRTPALLPCPGFGSADPWLTKSG